MPAPGSSKTCLSALLLLTIECFALGLLASGCSNSSPSPGSSPSPSTPPFNTAEGEGTLVGNPTVTNYSTASSASQAGLDSFYNQTICPSGLSAPGCATNQASLDTAEFGNFDLASDPIANNPLGIKQVAGVKIDYTAINIDQSPVTVSGGVAIPQVAPASIKGLILYYHGTTTQRTNVPSVFAPIAPSSTYTDGTLLAAVWASQGYVVVMPDYIGLGDDTTHPHPYVVYPAQNAQSGLAMVNAARTLLAGSYQITGQLPLFITGYSEGGAYALEAGHLMQNNTGYASQLNVRLTKVIPLSGFFDLSGTGLSYLFYNITNSDNPWHSLDPQTSELSKPFLTAYLTLSFSHYAKVPAIGILNNVFYVSGCYSQYPGAVATGSDLYDVYFTDSQYEGYDVAVLATADCQAVATGWASGPTNYSNAITPLLTETYATALMQKDTSNPLYEAVVNADTYLFTPRFPVTLLSLQQDSVVTRTNTDVAYAYFQQQNSGVSYNEELVPNSDFAIAGTLGDGQVDHTTEVPFLSVLILNQCNTAIQ
ncbi:MAG: lipase family protein [Acidobacteriaceae bacterium]